MPECSSLFRVTLNELGNIMAIDTVLMVREGYLYYLVRGQTNLADMKALADRIRDDAQRENRQSVLLDCGGLSGALSLGELFEAGEYFASQVPSTIKLAGVHMPPEWSDNEFSEHVVSNRGGQLRHFVSLEDAEAWFAEDG